MSLLLLFPGYNPPAGVSASEPYTQVLLETAPNVFSDISDDFRTGYTNRGRQRELDRYQAGTCSLDLSNGDRTYDPLYEDGDYYPYIKPGRYLQVLASYGGTTYPQFTGKVDGWSNRSNGPNDAIATVRATDAFKDLNKAALSGSVYELEIREDDPRLWWRFGDNVGSTAAVDTMQGVSATAELSPTFGTAGLVTADSDTAVTIDADNEGFRLTPALALEHGISGTGPFTIEFIIKVPDTSGMTEVGYLYLQNINGLQGIIQVFIDTAGTVTFNMLDFSTGDLEEAESAAIDDNSPHHVACVYGTDKFLRIYIDGVLSDTSASTFITTIPSPTNMVLTHSFTVAAIIDELAVYDTALSASRITAHSDAVSVPWTGDLPGERIERLLDYVGTPEGSRDLDTGNSVLQAASLSGSVLEHAQKVAESEFGALWISAGGVVVFEDRHSQLNQSSQATFGDDPADPTELGYRALTPLYDDTLIRNPVTVSRSGGVPQTVMDQDLIDNEYGINSFSLEGLLHDSDSLSRNAAQFLLSEYKEPKRRITDMTVGPPAIGKEATLYPQMLGRELTDKITVIERPQGVGDPIEQTSIIEGIQQTFGPKHWQTKWQLSPALSTSVFSWGPSSVVAKWGDGGVTVTGARWTF
jgi:concanavalin A-like lectin/glucanase superfamily protein